MRYIFGDCRLDTSSREFARAGAAVHLSPKAFDLLRLLIEQRPRVLAKPELMDALWQDTFVVEANLPVLIGELRTALGEKPSGGGSIKTHHGIGYSFVADVRESRSRAGQATAGTQRVILAIENRRITLGAGRNEVGREEECDVFLNDASVSRHHARISVETAAVNVEDLDSKNGTQVNGKRISKPTPVMDGDTITFGTVEGRVRISRVLDPSTMTI